MYCLKMQSPVDLHIYDACSDGYYFDKCLNEVELIDNCSEYGQWLYIPNNPSHEICYRCKREIHPKCICGIILWDTY